MRRADLDVMNGLRWDVRSYGAGLIFELWGIQTRREVESRGLSKSGIGRFLPSGEVLEFVVDWIDFGVYRSGVEVPRSTGNEVYAVHFSEN
jgi:hypothetical protein